MGLAIDNPAGQDRILVEASGSASNATNTIYTVPAGKVLYVCAMACEVVTDDTLIGADASMRYVSSGTTYRVFWWPDMDYSAATVMFLDSNTISFNPPLKLIAGDTIAVRTDDADAECQGYFYGYLEDA